jgi:hypothetical protein
MRARPLVVQMHQPEMMRPRLGEFGAITDPSPARRHAHPGLPGSYPREGYEMKKLLLAAILGTVVFGSVYAFAATLTTNTKSLGSGGNQVAACNSTAAVTYDTAYSDTLPGYKVSTAPINSAPTCATMAYKLTLTGTNNASLGEVTGTLDANGTASPDFSANDVAASAVTGLQLTISG